MSYTTQLDGVTGQMAEEIRSFDWGKTCLGPMSSWPLSLLTTLRLVLTTRQPMCFWWGEDLLQFHNDSYLPILKAGKPVLSDSQFVNIGLMCGREWSPS